MQGTETEQPATQFANLEGIVAAGEGFGKM